MKPIAFVIPWYGDNIRGGAEMECNHLAHCFASANIEVEVFTTCVKDAASDRGVNILKEGVRTENGILVRRFKVRERNVDNFNRANLKLFNNQPVTLEEEEMYFKEDINSPDMYKYVNKHKSEYQYFIFMPYLYGPTYYGSQQCPDNCVIIPCFHDESYAYMELTKDRMRTFKGMIFLSKPERDLAYELYDLSNVKTAVLGAYVESEWHNNCNKDEFRVKYKIESDFILYAGRKDAGKKADELVDFFIRYKKTNPHRNIKLVFIGGGQLEIPKNFESEIIDIGFVSVEDKHNALAAATFLCNPSHFESFSIVIMESWLAKRPVLVSEHCTVTKNFCLDTNGGLYFDDFAIFCKCIDFLLDNKNIASQMGENGFKYVMNNFTHDKITKKYLEFLKDL
ncbi:MAG: glycosyltransferase family 4 protein [Anaerocolumna sp.]